jgi:Ni/Co efflux regulator RcnB
MKKLILLALVCTGFAVTTPFTAQALDSDKIAQYDRNRNRNDQNSDNQDRDNQDRDNEGRATQSCDRLFIVYYRNYDDRKWIYESKHCNRRDARRAANRLERRGYRTQTL